jgi:hypothetical protein
LPDTLNFVCLYCSPKLADGNSEFDGEKVEEFYKGLFSDLTVDKEENAEMLAFFQENIPPVGSLVALRATAFKAAAEFISEDDKDTNIALLKCINVAVHGFETTCLV